MTNWNKKWSKKCVAKTVDLKKKKKNGKLRWILQKPKEPDQRSAGPLLILLFDQCDMDHLCAVFQLKDSRHNMHFFSQFVSETIFEKSVDPNK